LSAEHRLSREQLEALAPGDTVTIQRAGDLRRPRRELGTVLRLQGSRLVVSTTGARGGVYIEEFSRRDGLGLGGSRPLQLVDDVADSPATGEQRRQQMRIDAAYRAWARNRSDLGKLRELQAVVRTALADASVPV
jgi:hypothetical protein